MDECVKIRGYRIEIGEIEKNLVQHPEVIKCKVIAIDNKDICAYFISKSQDTSIKSNDLRAFVEKRLPSYMIPSCFIQLKEFPLTPSGKINFDSLPKPDNRVLIDENFIESLNTNEEKLKAIFAKVLKIDMKSLDTERNFFTMGGNSLKIIEITKLVESVFEREMPVSTVFKYPSVDALSEFLSNKNTSEIKESGRVEEAKKLRQKRALRNTK
jgi:tyrocidine synthetase III